jgi:Nickel responsive protein SCO4226-like
MNQLKYLTKIIHVAVPRFLDVHPMKGLDGALLRELQNAPADEFGIIHLNIMYNPEVDQCYCLVEAPTVEAVQKHHDKFGIKCDWIMEVKTTN